MNPTVFLTGLGMGSSLIVAIGAQNTFILRQALRREHILAVILVCALSDAVLISFGVAGSRRLIAELPWLEPGMRFGGAAFLFCYGARSLWSALRSSESLLAGADHPHPLGRTLAECMAFTWLNPHTYLDTVVLLGAVSTQFPGAGVSFAAGATTASVAFFFTLGYGARLLSPLLANPTSWRVLEGAIGLTMWAIAARVLAGF